MTKLEPNHQTMNTEQDLSKLNEQSVEIEQAGGPRARAFFEPILSEQLVFRRASGRIVGKTGPDGFLDGLNKPSPFSSRHSEEVSVIPLNDRALVTLIVAGTRADDGSVHLYRNIRLFSGPPWVMEFWYNFEVTGP